MSDIQLKIIREITDFIKDRQSLVLATRCPDQNPYSSYSPFITDSQDFFILLSGLAPHCRNLLRHSYTHAMLIEDESECPQIYARRRFSFSCQSSVVERDSAEWPELETAFERRFGNIIPTLTALADFQIFRLHSEKGLWVTGFGKAFEISGKNLDKVLHINAALLKKM